MGREVSLRLWRRGEVFERQDIFSNESFVGESLKEFLPNRITSCQRRRHESFRSLKFSKFSKRFVGSDTKSRSLGDIFWILEIGCRRRRISESLYAREFVCAFRVLHFLINHLCFLFVGCGKFGKAKVCEVIRIEQFAKNGKWSTQWFPKSRSIEVSKYRR